MWNWPHKGLWKGTAFSRAVSPVDMMTARPEAAPFQDLNADLPVFRLLSRTVQIPIKTGEGLNLRQLFFQ